MHSVGYIGSAGDGTVARQLLSRGTCQLKLWWPEQSPQDIETFNGVEVDLEELAECPLIVIATAIKDCRTAARRLGNFISGRQVLVHSIRSLEEGTLKSASTILGEETPTRRLGFVTGPMQLQDITDEKPAAAVCASRFPEVHDLIDDAMSSSCFRLYRSRDLRGAEFAAAYGRLIALMSGAADGLGLGTSLQATLFARGLAEMSRFVEAIGGNHRTPFGLAGAGNLYVDTVSRHNLDFQMGHFLTQEPERGAPELAQAFDEPARELLHLLSAFEEVAETHDLHLHLLNATDALLYGGISIIDAVNHLMTLPVLDE